ncbi:MAG: threonine synthase [Pseudomonadota bacterium]
MKYISTRGEAPALEFDDVLLAGLARDGGLYVPETYPELSSVEIAAMAGKSFADIAETVIAPFVGETIDRGALSQILHTAYSAPEPFHHQAITPLVQVGRNTFVLELFHGPTLAFKDVAMQVLARLMDHVLAKRTQTAMIVGATSGDTGGAAIEAFRKSSRARMMILYPQGRVSDVQRRMMTTPTEKSVSTLAVDGTFDDCQALVKAMFADHDFRDRVALSGVNSINWARIVAQVTYYFVAAVALGAPRRKVSFAVPTGNFGDIFAGYVAKRMGLPIETLVIASNDNDILPRTTTTGVYEKRGVVATTSPSMDIQVSSNFERWLFEAQGRDAALVRSQMRSLQQSGAFEVQGGSSVVQADFHAGAASEAEVAKVVETALSASGYLVEPHTACALKVVSDLTATKACDPSVPMVVLATAHPAKFPEAMARITGRATPLPSRLSHLMSEPEVTQPIANDLAAIKAAVEAMAHNTTR